MTIEAIAAGKDIYCEKPVSNTVEAAVRMREAARKSNRIIQIGTQQRSWTHFVEVGREQSHVSFKPFEAIAV